MTTHPANRDEPQAVAARALLDQHCPICAARKVEPWLRSSDRFHGHTEAFDCLQYSSCGVGWTTRPPTGSDWSRYYTQEYHDTITRAARTSLTKWTCFAEAIRPYKRHGALLDMGCGSGSFLAHMRGHGWTLSGIEASATVAEQAAAVSGAAVQANSVADGDFEPSSFDVITAIDLLEHVSDPHELIAKAVTWLKPGGLLLVFVPNKNAWEATLFGTYWYGLEVPRHLFHYTPVSLTHLMHSHGLRQHSLSTNKGNYFEHSVSYLVADAMRRLGRPWTPPLRSGHRGLGWRIAQGLIDRTIARPLASLAARHLAGTALLGLYTKPEEGMSGTVAREAWQARLDR